MEKETSVRQQEFIPFRDKWKYKKQPTGEEAEIDIRNDENW